MGEWSNLTNIFQRGWNHQLDIFDVEFSGVGTLQLEKTKSSKLFSRLWKITLLGFKTGTKIPGLWRFIFWSHKKNEAFEAPNLHSDWYAMRHAALGLD